MKWSVSSVLTFVPSERSKKRKRKEAVTLYRDTPAIDEEELIMRPLAGYGADPEFFGF